MKLHTLADIRTERAYKLVATAPSWLKIRSIETGRVIGYGVPSQSLPGLFHKANATTCDCKAWEYRHTCVHQRAVELFETPAYDASEMPASATLDGLAQMVRNRQVEDIFKRFED